MKQFDDEGQTKIECVNVLDGIISCPITSNSQDGQLSISEGEKSFRIDGWIGTFHRSGDSKTADGDNLNAIQIIFNNKLADEDFLRKISGKEVARSYIVGRVRADFIADLDDPITSSRQGLDDSVVEIAALSEYIKNLYSEIVRFWNENRPGSNTKKIFDKYPKIRDWAQGFSGNPDMKTYVNKLFNGISKIEFTDEDQEKLMIRNAVLAFENASLLNQMVKLTNMLENEDDISKIVLEFNSLTTIEAMKYRDIIRNRLDIVMKLDRAVSENAKEKILQELLAKNLWLINQSWDEGTDISRSEQRLIDEFNETDDRLKSKRFDIMFKQPHISELPVLIELKRPDAKSYSPTRYEAEAQIDAYRKSAAKHYNDILGRNIRYKDIKGIFIWQENNKISGESPEDVSNWLANNNLQIIKYSEIIHNVETNYREYLNASSEISSKLGFLMEDDWDI